MSITGTICFQLAKLIKKKQGDWDISTTAAFTDNPTQSSTHAKGSIVNPNTFSSSDYSDWRQDELRSQFMDHFDKSSVAGKEVLDFGCGYGGLCFLVADLGAARVVGLDLLGDDIAIARKNAARWESPTLDPEFHVASRNDCIDLPDDSFSVILCFDVLEHIMRYESIIPEWRRILKPGGKILIWWQPYYHPYGHHMHNYVPIPWVHVLFSKKAVAEACTRIYYSPQYKPRFWDLDGEGNKRNDKTFHPDYLGGVNGLTIRQFETQCRQYGLVLERREVHPFSGPTIIRTISAILCKIPILRDYFSAYMIYEIALPPV